MSVLLTHHISLKYTAVCKDVRSIIFAEVNNSDMYFKMCVLGFLHQVAAMYKINTFV